MDDVITQIGRAMAARRVTQAELARRIGHASHAAVSRLLSRQHEPGIELLTAIATALGTELVVPAREAVRIQPDHSAHVAACYAVAREQGV